MQLVKIIALEPDDLPIISTMMQDGLVRVGDLHFVPGKKRFALVANRFDWQDLADKKTAKRKQAGVVFSQVESVRSQKILLDNKDGILSLLSIGFEPGLNEPGGTVTLTFSGGGTIELGVECLEVQMEDLGTAWETANVPTHDQE